MSHDPCVECAVVDIFYLDDRNIGRFSTIAKGLDPGKHRVTCELLEDTLDPQGGTQFRMISLMRYVHHFL